MRFGAQRLAAVLGLVALGGALAGCAGPAGGGPRTTGAAAVVVGGSGAGTAGTSLDMALPDTVRSIVFTDEHGRHLTLGSLAGTDLVITDFLTDCQEICPMTSVNIRDAAAAARAAGLGADRVRFLEITVDPRRDTVRKLAAYQRLFGAQPDWDFLTASPAGIAALWKGLGVATQRVPAGTPATRDWLTGAPLTYDIQHQDVVFLVDGRGHERWLEEGTPATLGQQPPLVLKRYLSAQGRANLAAPQGATWTVADVTGALARLTGTPVG